MSRLDRLEEGLFVEYSGSYTAVAAKNIDYETYDTIYTISYHKGEMPAFNVVKFCTITELKIAMREIAPLRNWRVVRHN